MDSVKTPKGSTLPLLKLKGKDYLQVAHRLVWFNEEVSKFVMKTEFPHLTDEQTICRVTVTVMNEQGVPTREVSATKRETKKDFPDHTEKAETGAIGRALALLGFGTQFALADLDEGDRLADSPVVNPKTFTTPAPKPAAAPVKPEPPKAAAPVVTAESKQFVTPASPEADVDMPKEQPKPAAPVKPSFKKPSANKGSW